eukprot:6177915-Pleurochrysis_carterae.AAC.1
MWNSSSSCRCGSTASSSESDSALTTRTHKEAPVIYRLQGSVSARASMGVGVCAVLMRGCRRKRACVCAHASRRGGGAAPSTEGREQPRRERDGLWVATQRRNRRPRREHLRQSTVHAHLFASVRGTHAALAVEYGEGGRFGS